MRVSFYSAVVAVLATSAIAVQLECPCNDLPQPMLTTQVEDTTSTSSAANDNTEGGVGAILRAMEEKGRDATNAVKVTQKLEDRERKSKDAQIDQLRKDQERAVLRAHLNELEAQKKLKKEEEEKKAVEIDPSDWPKNHPDRAKLDILIHKEAKLVANKIMSQKKNDAKKAKVQVEKKTKAKDNEREKIVGEVSDAIKAVTQAAATNTTQNQTTTAAPAN